MLTLVVLELVVLDLVELCEIVDEEVTLPQGTALQSGTYLAES